MFDFEKPRIEIAEISEDNKYGRFVVEPLERGYGTTLGNSLRRIMLSSLPGAAVSAVKIKGVLHEFSSIPGVKEDVTEIILSLKDESEIADKNGYINVTYDTFIKNIRDLTKDIWDNSNKWHILLQEFMLTIENMKEDDKYGE